MTEKDEGHHAMLILDMGCGSKLRQGVVRVDLNDQFKPDVIWDLDKYPYPWGENTVDKIILDNILEHLKDPMEAIHECHRILRPQGELEIHVPYFRSPYAFIDPTHRTFYSIYSFDFYIKGTKIYDRYKYTDIEFKLQKRLFDYELGNPGLLKKLLINLANRYPSYYEFYFSHIIPLHQLSFCLIKQ